MYSTSRENKESIYVPFPLKSMGVRSSVENALNSRSNLFRNAQFNNSVYAAGRTVTDCRDTLAFQIQTAKRFLFVSIIIRSYTALTLRFRTRWCSV